MTQSPSSSVLRTDGVSRNTRVIEDTIGCPECGRQATVEWRTHVDGTLQLLAGDGEIHSQHHARRPRRRLRQGPPPLSTWLSGNSVT